MTDTCPTRLLARPRAGARPPVAVALGLSAAGLLLAACGGGTSPSSSSSGPAKSASSSSTTASTTTTTASTTTTTAAAAASNPKVGVAVESSPYGKILATSTGHTLYGLSSDTAKKSACYGACAALWPPLTVTAVPTMGAGLKETLFGQLVRTNHTHELTYGGHPLYTFKSDTRPHQTHGEGIKSNGGTWYVISAATGNFVKSKSKSSSSSSSWG